MKKILLTSIITIVTGITVANATDGDKKVTSKNYVDTAVATKQDVIDAEMMNLEFEGGTVSLPTLVSYDNTDNLTGTKYGIVDGGIRGQMEAVNTNNAQSQVLPTLDTVETYLNYRQITIPASGKYSSSLNTINTINPVNGVAQQNRWIDSSIKGIGLVTKTDRDGIVGERKIFEASDVSGYHAQSLSNNEKELQDISIPTVGAMMSAISNGVSAGLPTGTAGNVVTYDSNGEIGGQRGIYNYQYFLEEVSVDGDYLTTRDGVRSMTNATANGTNGNVVLYSGKNQYNQQTFTERATYDGSGTYNAGTDANKIATATAVETKQDKMTCTEWVANAAHTDANCLLWSINN